MIFGDTLKLQLSAKSAARLSRRGKHTNLLPEARPETQVTDAYFDTPRCGFFKTGTTFCIRSEGVRSTQVVRLPQPDGSAKTWQSPLPRRGARLDLGGGLAAELGLGPRARRGTSSARF